MFGNISPLQLIIILVIVLLLFGTKKLKNLGGDLGGAIKGFKKAIKEDNTANVEDKSSEEETLDAESVKSEEKQETK